MDIAKTFEILSQGKIISSNSSKHSDIANMLLNDNFFNEIDGLVDKLGFKLHATSGYFYLAKKYKLTTNEMQIFTNRHKELIVAIAFLRQLYPRLERNSVISFIDTVKNYGNIKQDDNTIKDKLIYCCANKNKDDEKSMLEQLFKLLEDKSVLEKISEDNSDKYKVLDSINYFLSIVDVIEKESNNA